MRVLLIEDDRSSARSVELMLTAEKFNVETVADGEEGLDLAQSYDYDAILLDLGLGDMSGLDVLRGLRRAGRKIPVMILTGAADVAARSRAFSGGADDYLVKPFHKDELTARLRAVIRRSSGHAESIITVGDIALNLDARIVQVNGARVHLTGKEYQTLELLALAAARPCTRTSSSPASMAAWTNPAARSSTSSSASCARSWPRSPTASTSRRSGAAAT